MKITDNQRLVSATTRHGYPIPCYDNGFGNLYVHRDSMGITGIVRAQTWEDAYSICEDEFFPDADEEALEEIQALDSAPDDEEHNHRRACWDEAYGFRPNGRRTVDGKCSHIYAKDLNGDSLDPLTDDLIAELGLAINISDFYELEVTTNGRNWWPFNGESKEEAMAAFEEWKAKGHGVTLERNGILIAHHPESNDE